MSVLGERIRKLRRERNWSQEKLARKIGTIRRLISRYETSAGTPSTDTLKKLANTFGVSVDFLLADPAETLADMKVDDNEFLGYMAEIKKMDEFDKKVLKAMIEAMILKSKMKALAKEEE